MKILKAEEVTEVGHYWDLTNNTPLLAFINGGGLRYMALGNSIVISTLNREHSYLGPVSGETLQALVKDAELTSGKKGKDAQQIAEIIRHFYGQSDGITVWFPSEAIREVYRFLMDLPTEEKK